MASNTENLNLLMKNPSTDGADTFNVQTMLNENWQKIDNNAGIVAQTLANILKPTTPPLIGLPPSTTPDSMFQALGNTGELHVWRKTVTTAQEIPAGYTLGAETNTKLCYMYYTDGMSVSYASSVSIDDAGNVSLVSPSSISFDSQDVNNVAITKGKFVKFTATNSSNIATPGVYFIPTDATFTYVMSGTSANQGLYCDKAQKVNAYPLTPAETTTTYPVSTNPKAYQEGDDAKAAGYVVGEVVTGKFRLGYSSSSTTCSYYYADELNVSENGNISISTSNSITISRNVSLSALKSTIAGKFVQLYNSSALNATGPDSTGPFGSIPGEIVFIPPNADFKSENIVFDEANGFSNDYFTIDRYQPITGYAAIPAGTTIEYLGKLGDKARVQVVSYVGTGTYGKDNPCSLTFDFAPKVVMFLVLRLTSGTYVNQTDSNGVLTKIPVATLNDSEWTKCFGNRQYVSAKKSNDSKVIYWFSTNSADTQWNYAGNTYYFLGIS